MDIILLLGGMTPIIALILIGWLIKYKKAYFLISGYNTMPAAQKKNVDTQGLGNFIGNACFIMAGFILAALVFIQLKITVMTNILFASLFPVIIYTLITAQKYDGNTRDSRGKMNKKTKITLGVIISILLLTAAGLGVLVSSSSKPVDFTVQNGILQIPGLYGQEIPLTEVTALELTNAIPEITHKTNGSALGDMYKGNFKLQGNQDAKLYIDRSKPPFIKIYWQNKLIILNSKDSEQTELLYQQLYDEWRNK